MDLLEEEEFKSAVAYVADPKNAKLFSDDTKLSFYALYKQATAGDLPSSLAAPSMFQVVARAKFTAWQKLRGVKPEAAKQKYVDTLREVDSTWHGKSNGQAVKLEKQVSTEPRLGRNTFELTHYESSSSPAPSLPTHDATALSNNSLFRPAVRACGLLFALGLAGFIFTILSWNSLFFLGVACCGLIGLIGSLMIYWDENGLLAFLSEPTRGLLLESTLLEFIIDDKLFLETKEFIVQVLPAFLAKDEARMLETLRHMSPRLRQRLTTKGLVQLMSSQMQRFLLPRALRQHLQSTPATYKLPRKIKSDNIKVAELVNDSKNAKEDEKPNLDLSWGLFRELFAENVSKRNVEFIMAVFNPKLLQQVAITCGSLTLMQLLLSGESRKFFISFVRASVLLSCAGGAGVSGGLLALWFAAKNKSKQDRNSKQDHE